MIDKMGARHIGVFAERVDIDRHRQRQNLAGIAYIDLVTVGPF